MEHIIYLMNIGSAIGYHLQSSFGRLQTCYRLGNKVIKYKKPHFDEVKMIELVLAVIYLGRSTWMLIIYQKAPRVIED
jgi:hypothetical protein